MSVESAQNCAVHASFGPEHVHTQKNGGTRILNWFSQSEIEFQCLRIGKGQFWFLQTKESENNNSNSLLEEEFGFQSPVWSPICLGFLVTRVSKKRPLWFP
jgi:hypothetical protein